MPFCSVFDCKYRTTRSSSIRVFQLPSGTQPFLVNQRRLWQHAIREANGDTETLLVHPRVCAAHFISGEASSDFESPDFVPSVFPCKQERKTSSQKIKTCSKAFKSKACSPEPMTRSQESENRTPESQTHTPERKTRSQERKTHTPEHMTGAPENENCTPESKNRTPERKTRGHDSKTHTPLRKTCSQEGKGSTQGIQTRSQESKIRIQQRENRKRKKNCIFGSRKRRHWTARSKTDESPLDLQPSALKEAQNELSEEEEEEEEEQTPLSSSVQKEGETLTDAGKVSFRSQTTSGLNGIPPSLPADVTALLKRRLVVCLKRLVVPTTEFRCELCSETFSSPPLLAKHKEVHDENSHFICEICGMSFKVQEEFTAHQSDHPKLEPYFPCNMCNRSFSTIRHLKRHKLLHVKDGRKCLKCGTLFCQRHKHILYLPQPKAKSESEGESEEEEKAAGEESQEVECNLMTKKDSLVKTETLASSEKARIISPPTNSPVVTVSMIPVLGVFHKSRMASTSLPHIEILPQFSLKTTEPSPLPRPPPVLLLPPLPPSSATPLLPTPPPPTHSLLPPLLKYPSEDIHPSIQPKIEEPDPRAAEEPFVPQCSDFPPSLKMFSPQYLTSALLEVKRNYESIFNKPKRFKGVMKKEESDPLPVSSRSHLIKPGMTRRVAYDLEVVL